MENLTYYIVLLALIIIGFIVVIKLGYYMAEAPYHPFWGVDYSKRFLTLGGVMGMCFALSFITFKIKQPADKEQKCGSSIPTPMCFRIILQNTRSPHFPDRAVSHLF